MTATERPTVGSARLRHPTSRAVGARPATRQAPPGRRSGRFLLLGALVGTLSLLGLVMVLSASFVTDLHRSGDAWLHLRRQAVYLLGGVVAMVVTLRIDYRRWADWATPMLGAAVLLLVAVLVPGVGVTANGATRWIGAGPLTFQPSEIAKLAMVVWTAELLSRSKRPADALHLTLKPVLVVTGFVTGLIMLQPNLGTTIIVVAIVMSLLFLCGVPLRALAAVGALGAGGLGLLAMAADYRRARILGALDPWSDPLDTGYQTIQSLVSVANGSVAGVGIGASSGKWGFLPFAHTDFIFAIVAEEVGLVGATFVVVAFLGIGAVGLSVALRAPDHFGMLLAAGITAWILVQAFINIGAVLGMLPITGVPLPFLSFGGSSLIVVFAAMGILMNVARQGR
jgi:cell division protein FtsW